MNQNGKKSKGNCIATIILFGFFSLLLVGFGIINLINHGDYYFGHAQDISDMTADGTSPQKGEYVQVGVDVCFDWYAETTHKVNGIPTGKEQHCIIMLENGDIMSLTVKGKKNYAKIDEVIDATWDYMYDETGMKSLHTPVIFEGKITSVGSEVSKYYRDYMSDLSDGFYNAWGYRPNYYELTIDTTDNKLSTLGYYIGGALIAALFVFVIVSNIKTLKALKAADKAGYDSNAYMQNRQNNLYGSNQDNIYGNDIAGYSSNSANTTNNNYGNDISGYSNMPENSYVNDIVNGNQNDNNGGFGI
ncbi:MAG: hypothetical protein IJ224_05850 [Lachnospiraceae bacterium]|nr:hypothetical protein [Lachnospiraceae bacterium]